MRWFRKRWVSIMFFGISSLVLMLGQKGEPPEHRSPALSAKLTQTPRPSPATRNLLPPVAPTANLNTVAASSDIWRNAQVLAEESQPGEGGAILRVRVLAEPSMRYRIRTEALLERTQGGKEV